MTRSKFFFFFWEKLGRDRILRDLDEELRDAEVEKKRKVKEERRKQLRKEVEDQMKKDLETVMNQPKPIKGTKPVKEEKPVTGPKPVKEEKPVTGPKPVKEKKPVTGPKPVKEKKPVTGPKPVKEEKPVTGPKPSTRSEGVTDSKADEAASCVSRLISSLKFLSWVAMLLLLTWGTFFTTKNLSRNFHRILRRQIPQVRHTAPRRLLPVHPRLQQKHPTPRHQPFPIHTRRPPFKFPKSPPHLHHNHSQHHPKPRPLPPDPLPLNHLQKIPIHLPNPNPKLPHNQPNPPNPPTKRPQKPQFPYQRTHSLPQNQIHCNFLNL
jgi:hypothetical protein